MFRTLLLLLILPGMAVGQGTDIVIFELADASAILSHRVTDREGYDSQPAFSADSSDLYFSSDREGGQVDLFAYSMADKSTRNLTRTPELNEFSAQPYADDEFSYVLQEGSPYQNVWHQPLAGGEKKRLLTSYIPAGYYARNDSGVLFWGRYAYALFFEPAGVDVGPANGESLFVISQAGRSIHPIPGSANFSFVHKQSNWSWVIKQFDPASKSISPVVAIATDNEDYCWHPEGRLFIGDGQSVLRFDPEKDSQWQPFADLKLPTGLGSMGRCAVSPDGQYLAVVFDRS